MQKNDDKLAGGRGFAVCAVRGIAASIAIMLLLFALFALLIASGRVSEGIMSVLLMAAAFLGCFIGAAIAIKRHGRRALTMGLTVAGALFSLSLVGAAFSEGEGFIGPLTPALFLILAASGILSSLMSVRKKGRKRG